MEILEARYWSRPGCPVEGVIWLAAEPRRSSRIDIRRKQFFMRKKNSARGDDFGAGVQSFLETRA
jgi:hypothetical protein